MTLTETRPEQDVDTAPEPVAVAPETWLTTSDHKKLGSVFLGFSLLFLLTGGILALVLRGQLAEGDLIAADTYGRLFNMHATIMTTLFLAPAWLGLATYLVPLQIGSGRLALPRLHALALWLYVAGGGVLVAAYIDGVPNGLGITIPVAPVAHGHANHATLLWIAGLILVAVSTILAATSILSTVLLFRTDGMTLRRVPAFSWASLVTSTVLVLSTPVFLAGLILLFLDQRFGGHFFSSTGSALVWQHTLWLIGRPEIYLLVLPGLGAACDMVATHVRRPLLSHDGAIVLLGAFGVFSLLAWAAGSRVAHAVVLPTYTPLVSIIVVPVAGLVLLWLGTARAGRPRFDVSLLFIAGFVLLLVTAAANAVYAAIDHVDAPSAWTGANLHTAVFGPATLLVFGAVYHWAPKLWGRRLSQLFGAGVFLLLFGGFFINGMAGYVLGYKGAANHVADIGTGDSFQTFSRVAAAGGIIVVLGVVL